MSTTVLEGNRSHQTTERKPIGGAMGSMPEDGMHDDAADTVRLALDEKNYARWGWAVVLLGFAGFMAWAALAPLDKGVPASGTVIVSGNRKAVQSAVDGAVGRILVREGEQVAAGQPLLRLDETPAYTAAAALRIQLATARASVARLTAERDGTPAITFDADLQGPEASVGVRDALALQRQLFEARRQALRSELDAMREAVAGHEAELHGLRATLAARRQQQQALDEQATGLRTLAADGYVSRNRMLETERLLAQNLAAMSEDGGRIGQLQRQVAEQRLRIVQRQEQFQSEVRASLADARLEVAATAERLTAAEYALGHTTIAAPAAGQVVGLAVFTEGGFVRAGETLMEVVPGGQPLTVQAQVPVNLIDTVRPGLDVELMFTAFNQNRTPRIPGRVRVVGADRLIEERTGLPYFPMEVEVTPDGMDKLAGLDLRPGMPAEVFVRTGERSMLSYLFKPVMDRAHRALGEE